MNMDLVLMLDYLFMEEHWYALVNGKNSFSVLLSEKAQRVHGEWASLLCFNLSVSCRTNLHSEVSNLLKAWESSTRKLWNFFEGNGFILAWIDQHVKRILGKRHLSNLIQKRDVEAMGMVISVELGMGRPGVQPQTDTLWTSNFCLANSPFNGLCPIHFMPLKTFETPQTCRKIIPYSFLFWGKSQW